jgi:translation initiation factor IF-2
MAEYRLAKVASELNRSAQALAEFLNGKGFDVAPKPTTKITEEMYDVLLQEFSKDKAAKDEAKLLKTQRDIRQGTAIPPSTVAKPTAPKVEERPAPVKVEPELTPDPVIEEPIIVETPEKTEVRKEELVGPKILGKIDLNPKKSAPKEVEKVVETIVEPPVAIKEEIVKEEKAEVKEIQIPVEAPVEPPTESIENTDTISETTGEEEEDVEKIETKFEKLSGPKVLGKINLPAAPSGVKALAGDAREDLREKRKRKRKQAGTEKVAVQEKIKQDEKQTFNTGPKKPEVKTEISQKDVQSKIKNTMGKIGNAGKTRGLKQKIKQQNKESRAQEMARNERLREQASKILKVTEFLTANELASMMNMAVTQVISSCFQLGMMVSINQRLDAETIQLVADNFGYEVEFVDAESTIEAMDNEVDREEDLKPRAPIVTVMGHVDHGKTSLLDNIRKSNVIAGEAGGITQHIGSYEVTMENGKKITFLDTPGHEAFTAMRARGAKVTDIAIIVIAADDAVMPQTREAIAHSQAAGVPMIFALNKVDKDGANSDRIREQLAAMNILVEDWGGKFQCQEISAKKGMNIDKLLEKVLLEAEMMELKANPNRNAKGTVIEATQEKGRGIVCNLLVQNGTLKVGDHIVAGPYYTKVRAMFNERGGKIDEAPPSAPVRILGFSEAPTAGDIFVVFEEESEAKQLANKRLQLIREQGIRTKRHITLDEIGRRLAIGNFKELKLIVKGDVDGSVEALSDSLLKLSTEEIAVNVIHSGVGQITESDVLLASASDAIIVGFQVRPSAKARQIAENEEIDIRTYSPEVVEKIIGNVEVRDVFKISKVGSVAGCYVTSGTIERKAKIRVIRDGVVIHSGELASLKRFKDDVKDVQKGYECGLQIERFNDIEVGDYLEVFKEEEVKRKL